MRVLTFTNLYPSAARPRHGIFVEHRVRRLVATGQVQSRVIAPVPWMLRDLPEYEDRYSIPVYYPRFLAIPKLTSWVNPLLMAMSAWPTVTALRRSGFDFDLIDAHFLYPDGAAAIFLGAWSGKPVVVTARGTDANDFTQYVVPRQWIKWVSRRAAELVTVSAGLKDALLKIGIAPDHVTVLRNGVDLEAFAPIPRERARHELGVSGPMLLSVGHLIPDKGHQFVIQALQSLPGKLVIAGDGPMRGELLALAQRCGVADRIIWAGTVSQAVLAKYYPAADATVLASRNEGMANVLIESLACGTPVIASNVGGNPEIVTAPAAGVLLKNRDAQSIVDAWHEVMKAPPSQTTVRQHAEQFGWAPTVQGLLRLFGTVTGSPAAAPAVVSGR